MARTDNCAADRLYSGDVTGLPLAFYRMPQNFSAVGYSIEVLFGSTLSQS